MSLVVNVIDGCHKNKNMLIADAILDNFKVGILKVLKQEGWI